MNYEIEIEVTANELATLKNALGAFEEDLNNRRKDCGFNRSGMERNHMLVLRECEIRSVRHKLARAKVMDHQARVSFL